MFCSAKKNDTHKGSDAGDALDCRGEPKMYKNAKTGDNIILLIPVRFCSEQAQTCIYESICKCMRTMVHLCMHVVVGVCIHV